MSSYSSQTVAQLKELLKAKGLSTAGVKSDLIARLEESDATVLSSAPEEADANEEPIVDAPQPDIAPVVPETKPEAETVAKSVPPPSKSSETTGAAAAAAAKKAEEAPAKVELSPEEKKQAAVELLSSKIKRAQKFGDEAAVKLHESELKRIDKFGLNLSSDIAFELGFGIKDKNFINKRRHGGGKKFKHGKPRRN